MKILAIRGKNLASLEGEFEVDFTTSPLSSAGIFAITGPTGSGKSTLLDAMCLALYEDTPRIDRANDNADIADVKDSTIKQKDPRSILRRGTIDGYAEVDFLALTGDKYRARWSVRRARNKIDGPLQKTNYNIFNIETNVELQGTKTELLKQVVDLIGLTFDQFTRAVLLAQGDFATFLKATKNEKAELLEKLTGTEIYSQISAKIYQNTKAAELNLNSVREKIKGVESLTDEQISALITERDQNINHISLLEEAIKVLETKIGWLDKESQLQENVKSAIEALEKCKIAIEEAKSRVEYLARIDSTTSIRDTFRQFKADKKTLGEDKLLLEEKSKAFATKKLELEEIKGNLLKLQDEKVVLTNKWVELDKQLKSARQLDTQIIEISKNVEVAKIEKENVSKEKAEISERITLTKKNIELAEEENVKISKWFEEYQKYSDIVTKIDLVSTLINDSLLTKSQIEDNEKLLASLTKSMAKDEEDLKTQQDEAKRLNDILPEEIAQLRTQLSEGSPCPVCGSLHHPFSITEVDTLEQKVLTKNKEGVQKEIERLTIAIDKAKENIIKVNSNLSNYKSISEKTFSNLSTILTPIPEWIKVYEDGALANLLTRVSLTWKENEKKGDVIKNNLTIFTQDLKSLEERLEGATKAEIEKQKKFDSIVAQLDKLKNERLSVLEGKDADIIEKGYQSEVSLNEDKLKFTTDNQTNVSAFVENIGGVIAQLNDNIARLEIAINKENKAIEEWLINRTDSMTITELENLLSQDNNWIEQERNSLDQLNKDVLTAKTTLEERERVLTEHQTEKIKPAEGETKESLLVNCNASKVDFNTKRDRNATIKAIFEENDKGKERIKHFEKELREKGEIAENWGKLNELYGSADGDKFKVLAQGYTLDVLLGYANKHLKEISDRYVLERVSPDSLSLQVVDLDMLSEVRSVHSLSGGESFLISLAMALGLSSLSSNKMNIESLFIDEGFGTLDADTLRIAMDALEKLQITGRKIGVISHVAEMTERIHSQIKVVKTSNGKSHIEVI